MSGRTTSSARPKLARGTEWVAAHFSLDRALELTPLAPLQVLDPALAFLVATLARDQRIAEALCRISSTAFGVVKSVNDDAVYDEPICDVLSVLGTMLGRSWAGEEIGKKDVKGLSKGDARTVSLVLLQRDHQRSR